MINVSIANRQCCDLDVQGYKMKALQLYADFCNTAAMGFSSEPVYTNKRGRKYIKFDGPLGGAIAMTFQVHPFKVYAMLGDGGIETSAVITRKETVTCATAGSPTLANIPVAGTVLMYVEGDLGGEAIEGAVAEKIFTAATDSELAVGTSYVVSHLEEKKPDIKEVSFSDKKVPKDLYIQMSTLDKNEDGKLVPTRVTAHKVGPQGSLNLSFSSDGDSAEITIICNALMDDSGNVLDMIGISGEAE